MSKYAKEVNECLTKLQMGDISQMDELFKLTANHLSLVAKRYLINKDDYEDVVADVYVRAMKYIHSFNNERDGYNWLCKITRNVSYRYNNRYSKNAKETLEYQDNLIADKSNLINLIDAQAELSRALTCINDASKAVLYMHYYEGMSYAEIGEKLGISKGAVAKKVYGALHKMRKFLE